MEKLFYLTAFCETFAEGDFLFLFTEEALQKSFVE